jgi:hypothetical protein
MTNDSLHFVSRTLIQLALLQFQRRARRWMQMPASRNHSCTWRQRGSRVPCLQHKVHSNSVCVRALAPCTFLFLHSERENQGALASVLVRAPPCSSSGLTLLVRHLKSSTSYPLSSAILRHPELEHVRALTKRPTKQNDSQMSSTILSWDASRIERHLKDLNLHPSLQSGARFHTEKDE